MMYRKRVVSSVREKGRERDDGHCVWVSATNIAQLKLRPRCARCRKIGQWARECLETPQSEERFEQRPGEDQRGFTRFSITSEGIPYHHQGRNGTWQRMESPPCGRGDGAMPRYSVDGVVVALFPTGNLEDF